MTACATSRSIPEQGRTEYIYRPGDGTTHLEYLGMSLGPYFNRTCHEKVYGVYLTEHICSISSYLYRYST